MTSLAGCGGSRADRCCQGAQTGDQRRSAMYTLCFFLPASTLNLKKQLLKMLCGLSLCDCFQSFRLSAGEVDEQVFQDARDEARNKLLLGQRRIVDIGL